MSVYFVTGATGVVGSAIVGQLLAQPEARIKLLIRAGSADALQSRLDALVAFWQVDAALARARIEPLAGDTTEARFGLSEPDFARVARECTHLVHSAGVVRMNLPLAEARRAAVGAAQRVVEFADAARAAGGPLAKVEYISTVGVGGRMAGAVPERWLHEPRAFHNTYEQAKAEAESLVEAAVGRGVPITVHRPSMVVGDSRTGQALSYQIFYHLAEFLSGQRTFGVVPDPGRTQLDTVPVDYVARAVLWSAGQAGTAGRILHLCSGPAHAMPIRQLRVRVRNAFRRAGRRAPTGVLVPPALLRAALPLAKAVSDARNRRALDTLPIFLDYLAEAQAFDNTETLRTLGAAGIALPRPQDYLGTVLDRYLAQRAAAPGTRR